MSSGRVSLRQRLYSDTTRSGASLLLTMAAYVPTTALVLAVGGPAAAARASYLLSILVALVFWPAAYVLLTWWTFSSLPEVDLRTAVDVESARWRLARRQRRLWLRTLWTGGRAFGLSMSLAMVALLLVITIIIVPGLREDPLVLAIGLLAVATTWLSVIVTYALHYARLDTESPGAIGFPDDMTRSFSDYAYMATLTQTTFSTSDIELRTSHLRAVASGQGLLAYTFRTVAIALIISLLLEATS